tara:strand:- start:2899 stop:3426 length:528 start_codon:yes stop_codon:yes gene_type:complete
MGDNDAKTINISDDSIEIITQTTKQIKKPTKKKKTKVEDIVIPKKLNLDPEIITHKYNIIKQIVNEFYNKYIDYTLQDNNINENNKINKVSALNELKGYEVVTNITDVADLQKKIKNKFIRILWSRYLWNLKLTPLYKCTSITTTSPYKLKLFNFSNYFELIYPDNEDFLIFIQL